MYTSYLRDIHYGSTFNSIVKNLIFTDALSFKLTLSEIIRHEWFLCA